MTSIRNFTPHVVNIITEDGLVFSIPSEGIARCSEVEQQVGEINGIPLMEKTFGGVEGLPNPEMDTVFIVSMVTAKNAGRDDVVFPNGVIRDDEGKVIGCKSLARYPA